VVGGGVVVVVVVSVVLLFLDLDASAESVGLISSFVQLTNTDENKTKQDRMDKIRAWWLFIDSMFRG
jgi:hypothetical protein